MLSKFIYCFGCGAGTSNWCMRGSQEAVSVGREHVWVGPEEMCLPFGDGVPVRDSFLRSLPVQRKGERLGAVNDVVTCRARAV